MLSKQETFEESSLNDEDMELLQSESKLNSKPFLDIEETKEEDSELANVVKMQAI